MISQEVWMDIKQLHRQGMSLRAIARTTGLSRQTVRRALTQTVPVRYQPRSPKPGILAPHYEFLRSALAERPWVSAAQLFRELAPRGYRGHYEGVKVFCRRLRREQQAGRRACVRFETAPGVEAQFDWKGPVAGLLTCAPGTAVYFFRLVLGWSRFRLTRAVTLTTLPAVLADLIDVLQELGGVPQRLVFDNFRAAVLRPRPQLRLHPFFADFCAHYAVEPAPALPYSPQRKGKVERSFRDLAASDLLHRTYADLPALQQAVTEADREHSLRLHTTTGEQPAARLERERPFLRPLPATAFDPRMVETRRVLSDCTISFHGAAYSVPHLLVGKKVTVKADHRRSCFEVFDGATRVAGHQLAARGERILLEEHVAPLREPRWERTRNAAAGRCPPAAPDVSPLVVWPAVQVMQRALADYASLIEEVAR